MRASNGYAKGGAARPAPLVETRRNDDGEVLFRDAMAQLAASVCIVTTGDHSGHEGVTVSSFASVSIDGADQIVSVSLFAEAPVAQAILENETFCVSLLNADQEELANTFAGRTKTARADRFALGAWQTLDSGNFALRDAVAVFDCSLYDTKQIGRHCVMFGRVERTACDPMRQPLVHQARRFTKLSC